VIFSYYAEGCVEACMRDHIIRYFPRSSHAPASRFSRAAAGRG
jgi:hypothetical protein